MAKALFLTLLFVSLCLFAGNVSWATNGAQMIGVGPISRSMGGTGVANPQSGVSAVYLNPAMMGKFKQKTRVEFGASIASHNIDATYGTTSVKSEYAPFAIPAIGIITPLDDNMFLGLAAAGVGGMGTDYRETNLSGFSNVFIFQWDFMPAFSIEFMKKKLKFGISFPITMQILNMGSATTTNASVDHAYGLSVKIGAAYDFTKVLLGAYVKIPLITPRHDIGQANSNQPGTTSSILRVEPPMEIGLGTSFLFVKNLTINLDGKYIMWSKAKGYGDSSLDSQFGFDWKDQFVIAFGLQYQILKRLSGRLGYNYGSGVIKTDKSTASDTQGIFNLRAPALAKHHFTVGLGVGLTKALCLNLGFVYSPKESFSQLTTNQAGGTTTASGSMSQYSIDMGLSGEF